MVTLSRTKLPYGGGYMYRVRLDGQVINTMVTDDPFTENEQECVRQNYERFYEETHD